MEKKMIKLVQDWGKDCKKLSVEIDEESLVYELKRHFRWRKGDFKERFFKLGTYKYDAFIAVLAQKGY